MCVPEETEPQRVAQLKQGSSKMFSKPHTRQMLVFAYSFHSHDILPFNKQTDEISAFFSKYTVL
jgi:hypothetical protein